MKKSIEFKLNSEIELPQDFIDSIPSSGQADSYIDDLLLNYSIECSEKDAIKYLKSTGGWSLYELNNHDENIRRLAWIACLDCQEQDTNYFYMGC